MTAPPQSVLRAFGADDAPTRLPGGQGATWRAGDVVLKPLDMSTAELEWQADVLAQTAASGVRLAPPLRSRDGALVVEGWTCWPHLEGRHAPRWPEIIEAGDRLHAALAGVPRPSLLQTRSHRWSEADRVAWGEKAPSQPVSDPGLAWLLGARRPVSLPSQIVHGDLSGNVLFADDRPPAVIDFSPYWRPRPYASAIVLVDAVAWHGADASLLDGLAEQPAADQLLMRAAIFRLLSDTAPDAGRWDIVLGRLRLRVGI